MADNPAELRPDPFVVLSTETWRGLNVAVRELGWIAEGGDSSATSSDRDLANSMHGEYDRERRNVAYRLLDYYNKELTITPPSEPDLTTAKNIAAHLAQMRDVNVKATAIVKATTDLLDIYKKAN